LGIDVFFCKGEMMNIEKETSEYQRMLRNTPSREDVCFFTIPGQQTEKLS
jgi:hypothetical protein